MTRKHDYISFRKNPIIWMKDKARTVENKKLLYISGFFPSILAIIGFLVDANILWNIDKNSLYQIIFVLFFIYGLLNLYFSTLLQRVNVKLSRLQNQFDFFHSQMIHCVRDYFTEKSMLEKKGVMMDTDKIETTIKQIIKTFNEQYMYEHHRRNTNVTLKYALNNKLHIIRCGNNINNRNLKTEPLTDSVIYHTLFNESEKLSYLYVKDISNPDSKELRALGPYAKILQKKTLGNYKTVVAIPLNNAKIKTSVIDTTIESELGYVSFDLDEKYGFGNLYQYEIDIICSFVDLLSIIIGDFVKSKNREQYA